MPQHTEMTKTTRRMGTMTVWGTALMAVLALNTLGCMMWTTYPEGDECHGSRCGGGYDDWSSDPDRHDGTTGGDTTNNSSGGTTDGGTTGGDTTGGDCTAEDPTEVCGVDGLTYPTPCAASRAHVRVEHKGACGPPCAQDLDCALYETCEATGRCTPLECAPVSEPVCGADGITYGNACEARAHHVAETTPGECPPECLSDSECELGSICEQDRCVEADCPVLDAGDTSQEVCGEDAFTYQTACEARAMHVGVAHTGCCY